MIQQELNLKFVYDKEKNTIDFLKSEGFYATPVKQHVNMDDFQHEIENLYSKEEPYDIDEVDRGYDDTFHDEYDTMIENYVPSHEEIEEEWKRLEELEKTEPFNQPLNKPLEF